MTMNDVPESVERLACRLRTAGLCVTVQVRAGEWPRLEVVNPEAPALNEDVIVAPDNNGVWWLWSSWQERLTRLEDLEASSMRLARILAVCPSTSSPERPI